MNSYILFKRGILVALVAIFFAGGVGIFDSVESADLTAPKVELSTPRLSFHGKLDTNNTVGSSVVSLANTGAPSTETYNLFVGESVKINANSYEVIDADDGQIFQIDRGLEPGDEGVGEDVYVARTATMTISFATVSDIPDSSFIVRVPAATVGNADQIPDEDGWDAGGTITSTCSTGGSATLINNGAYLDFVCAYTGATPASAIITINGLINPTPDTDSTHTVGLADQYRIVIQHTDGTDVIDQSSAAVALIEAVRITASVAPSIELQLLGVNSGASACDIGTLSVTTTPTEVPLGELLITNFTTAAQQLKVSTNAQNGYVVTAIAEDQLRRQYVTACTGDGDSVTGCIPDSAGDTSAMDYNTSDTWINDATKGFAYTLNYVSATSGTPPTMTFEHDDGGSNQYRQFADEENNESPVTLFSSNSVADSHLVNVCYKAVIGATQEAGEDYATNVTYRATATF